MVSLDKNVKILTMANIAQDADLTNQSNLREKMCGCSGHVKNEKMFARESQFSCHC